MINSQRSSLNDYGLSNLLKEGLVFLDPNYFRAILISLVNDTWLYNAGLPVILVSFYKSKGLFSFGFLYPDRSLCCIFFINLDVHLDYNLVVFQDKYAPPPEKLVNIQIPPQLKKQLIDDCEFVNHLGKVKTC